MTGAAELVFFGIKAGIKLAQQGRQAYVEATIDRGITLPLPEFSVDLSIGNADGFFYGAGRSFVERMPRVRELYEISTGTAGGMSNDEKAEYLDIFADCSREHAIRTKGLTGKELSLSRDTLLSLVCVRQWASGKRPFPSAAQRVIGTLIEIGVDYAVSAKGLIDERSSAGKALKGFLSALDTISFSEGGVEEIAGSLFVALLETVEQNPALLNADPASERLILAVSHGLINDMQKRMEALSATDLGKRSSVKVWGQLIFRSVLTSAADTVLSDQGLYLGLRDEDGQKVVTAISLSLLDLVTTDDTIDFTRLFSRSGLEQIARAGLKAVAENPGVFGADHEGFRLIIQQTAKDLAELPSLYSPGVLSETVRIVIEKTALNSELLWPAAFRNDPAKHLVVTAAKETLLVLSRKDGSAGKAPLFAGIDAVAIMKAVADEVAQNPDWLVKPAGSDATLLREMLSSAIEAFRRVPNHRLDSAALRDILQSVIRTVALRREFLDPLPVGSAAGNALAQILGIVIDAVFSPEADAKATWVLARGDIFRILCDAVLEQAAVMGASDGVMKKLKDSLQKVAARIASGSGWSIKELVTEIRGIS